VRRETDGMDLPLDRAITTADVTGVLNRMTERSNVNAGRFSGLTDDWRNLQTDGRDKSQVIADLTKKGSVF
jgi:hypothetical protein